MKIHLAKYEPGRIGGGWTFMRNFSKGFNQEICDYEDAEIYFISSPSMVSREEVSKAVHDGKKIVLRLDNAVRNSRNRNTGMTRMSDFADWADLIIFQSQWALDYLRPFLASGNRNHDFFKPIQVILNGVDQTIFYPPSVRSGQDIILYSRFNRDETKNYEVARYWYSQYQLKNESAILYIVGQFSDELRQGNFDFYNGELFRYLGIISPQQLADTYRHSDKFLYTYYNDACSNSLIEALVSGCEIVGDEYYLQTGGAPEIMDKFRSHGSEYFTIERMCDEYRAAMEKIL